MNVVLHDLKAAGLVRLSTGRGGTVVRLVEVEEHDTAIVCAEPTVVSSPLPPRPCGEHDPDSAAEHVGGVLLTFSPLGMSFSCGCIAGRIQCFAY